YDFTSRQDFDFTSVTARYVDFVVVDNFFVEPGDGSVAGTDAGGDRVGLGEVAFPVPGGADAPTLDIDRVTGNAVLNNASTPDQVALDIAGYNILSAVGALDGAEWLSIAENYDADSGGSFDASNNWLVFGAEAGDIAEGSLGVATLDAGASVDLGNLWIPNPDEDVTIELLAADGSIVRIAVNFIGNNDAPFEVADLNFDGQIDALDWPIYRDGYRQDFAELSPAEAYQEGDLNYDGVNDVADFALFKSAFEAANGPGSFAALTGVPEPSTFVLAALPLAAIGLAKRRRLAVCAALAIATTFFSSSSTTLADVPFVVSHWPLDDNGNDAFGGNDGTATDVFFGEAGANANTGTSADFDGATSTIDVPYDPSLNPESFTVTVWALADVAADGFRSPITNRDDFMVGVSTHGYILYSNSGGSWDFWTGDGDPGWAALTGDPVTTGVWTHLALTFDAATNAKSLFIDGALAAQTFTQGYSQNGTVESENLHIGSGNDFGDQFYFDGLIDDVGVFDGVLTTDEIRNVADNGVAAFDLLRLKLEVDPDQGFA
ncbi:MAG: LamG-like jellyroll fold domain-containing protein, partial [Planctomycetota bacterium]